MALSLSTDQVDADQREMLTYGTEEFPIAFFGDDLTKIKVPWHWHDEMEMVILTRGSADFNIGSASFTLNAGDGCMINCGVLHAERLKSSAGDQHVMVFQPRLIAPEGDLIYRTYIQPTLDSACLPYVRFSSKIPWQQAALRQAERAWRAGAFDQEDYPLTVREGLSHFFQLLTRNLDSLGTEYALSSREQRTELRLKKALTYLETHFSEPISIEEIAGSANISVSTCLRIFHEVLHTTPIQYLNQYRLSRIANELRMRDGRLISEISFENGFTDTSYFNRCFRKKFGMTPQEYIRQGSAEES